MDTTKTGLSTIKRCFQKEICDHLPVWYLVCLAVVLTYAESRCFISSTRQYIWTVVFPLAWFYAYRLPLIPRSDSRFWIKLAGMVLLPLAAVLYAGLWAPAVGLDFGNGRILVEIGVIIVFAVMLIHCTVCRTRRMCLHIFILSLLYGAFFENAACLAGFVSATGYRVYIPGVPVPVYAMAGWATAVYVCVSLANRLRSKQTETVWQIALKSLLAVAVAISFDATINPAATWIGCWVWHADLGPKIMGVPIMHFVAITAILFPLFCSYFWYVRNPVRAAQVMLAPMIGSLVLAFVAAVLLIVLAVAIFFGLDSTPWHLLAQAIAHPLQTIR